MMATMDGPAINPEHLAYWYFRLNGFMTTVNFVVHPEQGSEQRTDVDVLGVRFPFRAELLSEPMVDDAPFTEEKQRPYVIIAEVKKDRCKLNGPWTRPHDQNMNRVLTAIGVIHPSEQDAAAAALYTTGVFQGGNVLLSLCCVGAMENREVRRQFPDVPQILWPQITAFIYQRFHTYFYQKLSHPQWDQTGRLLWQLCVDYRSADEFGSAVEHCLKAG
jgi:hypothetical protein